jgi:putative endonuclease
MDAFFMSTNQPFFVYIIFSESSNKYYVGQTQDLQQRIDTHNSTDGQRFTSKHQPWTLKVAFTFDSRSHARSIENYIKKRKSRSLIIWLTQDDSAQDFLDKKLLK